VLYLADSEVGHILAFEVLDGGARLGEPVTFAHLDPGPPDGIRVDPQGRVWSSCASGIQVFAARGPNEPGERLGSVAVPQRTANLAFGGPEGKTLAITATSGLYRLQTR
jgi:gluconolactonase